MRTTNTQINEFLNFISPTTQTAILSEFKERLHKQFPEQDDFWLDYWSIRIAFFTNWESDFHIQFDTLPDPSKITLTFIPDYGS